MQKPPAGLYLYTPQKWSEKPDHLTMGKRRRIAAETKAKVALAALSRNGEAEATSRFSIERMVQDYYRWFEVILAEG